MPSCFQPAPNPAPPCPGACPCLPEPSHVDPSHQGPLPCPHSPELCRPAPCRTPCGCTRTATTPADQRPPRPSPTTTTCATTLPTRCTLARALPSPHVASPHVPVPQAAWPRYHRTKSTTRSRGMRPDGPAEASSSHDYALLVDVARTDGTTRHDGSVVYVT